MCSACGPTNERTRLSLQRTQAGSPPVPPGGAIEEQVLREGDPNGVLAGFSFVVKDNIDVLGTATSVGSPPWAATHPPATSDAWVVASLLRSGARLVGKAYGDELAFNLDGVNEHFGAPLNGFAPDRLPGGSSSGPASAVSLKLCDFAVGTDTGGSVRVPAAYCGLFGFRPTAGVVPVTGIVPLAPSFDCVGLLTRDAKMLRKVLPGILPGSSQAQQIHTIRPLREDSYPIDPASRQDYLHELSSWGARIEMGDPFELPVPLEEVFRVRTLIQRFDTWTTHGEWILANRNSIGPQALERLLACAGVDKATYDQAQALAAEFRMQLTAALGPGEAVALPTSSAPAPLRTDHNNAKLRKEILILNALATLWGAPVMNVPVQTARGPFGVSLIAHAGSDLELAAVAETIRPG